MRESRPPTTTSCDAWVLLAIILCGEDADLTGIIVQADYINHAILTFDELDCSIAALLAHHLIEVHGSQFPPTLKARNLYRRVTARKRSLLGLWSALDRTMAGRFRTLWPRRRKDALRFGLSTKDYEDAVGEWSKEGDQIIRRIQDVSGR